MPALSVDRRSLRVTQGAFADRVLIGALDAYATLSRPFQQRGLYKACRLVGDIAWKGRDAAIALGPGAEISFPASDPYWNRMLLRSYDHEPEMARLLRRIASFDYGFVDCGANIGYWSVFVASPSCGGGKPVLAVEASASTYQLLAANTSRFPGRIACFHRAILDRSGVELRLNAEAHEARGVALAGEAPSAETVTSITIDDLVAQHGWGKRPLVAKLDVEGVEREALAGMQGCLAQDAMVIYEDHGADATHALTQHMLSEGLAVFLLLDDATLPITSAPEIDRYKTDRTKGYNLVALRPGSRWRPAVMD